MKSVEETVTVTGPLTVEQTTWGVGAAVERAFNPVAVQVRNDSARPFEGWVWLHPEGTVDRQQSRAEVAREVYLNPGETRTVRFGVYLSGRTDSWALSWQEDGNDAVGRQSLSPIAFRNPTTILVIDEPAGAGLPQLPSKAFPVQSTLLDGVEAIVLPAEPTWQTGQVQAFRQWLARGGRVVLAAEATEWSPELRELALPDDRFAFGHGQVVRTFDPVDELSADDVRRLTGRVIPKDTDGVFQQYAWDCDAEIMSSLEQAMTPRSLIWRFYALVFVYVVLLATLSFQTVRRRWSTRRYLGSLVATSVAMVVLFGWASPLAGELSGEAVSVAFLYELPDEASLPGDQPADGFARFDVRRFAQFRVPLGGEVRLGGGEDESVDGLAVAVGNHQTTGRVVDGPIQAGVFDVPGMANLRVRSRAVMTLEPPRWTRQRELQRIELRPANEAAEALTVVGGMVVEKGRVQLFRPLLSPSNLLQASNVLVDVGQTKTLKTFLVSPTMISTPINASPWRHALRRETTEDHIRDVAGRAVAVFDSSRGTVVPAHLASPAGQVRVAVLTKMPAALRVDGSAPDGAAYAVWVFQMAAESTDELE